MLKDRHIVVGISGGIAAYKAAELVRLCVQAEAEVQVVMTPAAERFITPLTLQALSRRRVATDLFDREAEATIGHIAIADWADLLVVTPATADVIARLAVGMADDLLTTVALATRAPLVVAPAMNTNMWNHPQTRTNLATLVGRGTRVVGPDNGDLACGWVGPGRMVDPSAILAACDELLGPRDLAGQAILVTAGPTHEAIDPVRYLGNRSSGKMGFALASAAATRGAKVTLVAGPVTLPTPPGVERLDVTSAREMRDAVLARESAMSCIIKAAAVADYRPTSASATKLKKAALGHDATLTLEPNPDILAELAERRRAHGSRRPVLVGFAAETGDLRKQAAIKLAQKGCDLLVANNVSEPGSGFGSDENHVILLAPDAPPEELARMPKPRVAHAILDRVAKLLAG